MDISKIAPSLLLALVAILLLGWLLRIILNAVFQSFLGGLSLPLWLILRKNNQRLMEADTLIESNKIRNAISLLKKSIIFDLRQRNTRGIEAVVAHHLGVLSRFGMIADQKGVQSEILPLIEGLLASRLEIWRQIVQAKENSSRIQKKIESQGEERPWVGAELNRRREDLKGRLKSNRQAIEQKLIELDEELSSETRRPNGYPFH